MSFRGIAAGARLSRRQWRRTWRASRLAFFLGIALTGAGASAGAGNSQRNDASAWVPRPPEQQRPIVNGHHVQPQPDDFDHPEFTPDQSRQVDDLYLQIMRMRDGEAREANRVLRSGRD
jgi:hypothetical protein